MSKLIRKAGSSQPSGRNGGGSEYDLWQHFCRVCGCHVTMELRRPDLKAPDPLDYICNRCHREKENG